MDIFKKRQNILDIISRLESDNNVIGEYTGLYDELYLPELDRKKIDFDHNRYVEILPFSEVLNFSKTTCRYTKNSKFYKILYSV